MTGAKVFEQFVAFSDRSGVPRAPIDLEDFEQWKKDYTWEALHGIRYGQSFCNHFNITDNHLYYAPGGIDWCDDYIKKTYLARS